MSTDKIKKDETDNPVIEPLEQIQIDAVFDSDGVRITSPLVGCFFAPQGPPQDPPQYMLLGQQGMRLLHGQIRDGERFTVDDFAGGKWHLTVCFSKNNKKACGTWSPHDDDGSGVDGDGGTYTAQAGGGVPSAVAASA